MKPARWIDLGLVSGETFHASYAAVAECQGDDAAPAVVWGRAIDHISLGQHQSARAELAWPRAVPAVRRPLGGGSVWIDPDQLCFALVVPLAQLSRRPAEWYGWGLAPAVAAFRALGLVVDCVDRDLWCAGRKIAGSGAATIGRSAVIGSSFMLHFPAARFAACVRSPSDGFRAWLAEELAAAVTSWSEHAVPPAAERIAAAFRGACAALFAWRIADTALTGAERAALADIVTDDEGDEDNGRRLVPDGIKLNARRYLREAQEGNAWARCVTDDGRIARIAVSEPAAARILACHTGAGNDVPALLAALDAGLPPVSAAVMRRLLARAAGFAA
ncbi:MAG: lipoate--protein ligase family protein [Pseudomonadota bacterium]